MKAIRPYEMSVWTLRDSYLATLKAPGVENKGQIEEPEFSLKNDGTQEIKFKIPMYYWHNNELVENPYWYDVKHGLLMTGLRKIKLIFNKRTKDEKVFEFLVTMVEELHDTNKSLYCSVAASSLVFQELGKRGYKISLSSDDFIQEYNDYLDLLDETEYTSEEYEEELKNAPKENINYWCDKLFENIDWDYSIQMDWTNYDGYFLYTIGSELSYLPIVDVAVISEIEGNQVVLMTKEEIDAILKEAGLTQRTATLDSRFISYSDLTEEEKEAVNNFRESIGLRRNDTIYEDDYIASWNVNADAQTVTPSSYEKFKEKWRPVDAEKSNIYNLTQTIAETFGVYCKYKYYYDDNYHIIRKEVIFYNNFMKEFDEGAELTYGYGLKKVKRVLDSNDIFTKMIVENVEDADSATGLISILNTPANAMGENYLLNFDYLYETGSITEDQYEAVDSFEKHIGFYNQQLKELESFIIKYQNEINDLNASIAISNNMVTQAQTQIEQSLSAITALTGTETGSITARGVFARFQEDTDGNYYIKITEKGVVADSTLGVYTKYDYATGNSSNEIAFQNIIFDSNGNIEKLTGFNITKEQANSLYAYLTYNYRPQLYYENIINTYLSIMKKQKQELETNEVVLAEIEGYFSSAEDNYEQLLSKKQELITDFENLMGPAIREGNWQPGDYKSLYSLDVVDFDFSSADLIQEFGDKKVLWDNESFEGELEGYYESGVTQDKIYYPCIRLDNIELLKGIEESLSPEAEDILRYSYEEIITHTANYLYDDNTNIYSYTAAAIFSSAESSQTFEAESIEALEEQILNFGIKQLTGQEDISKCTSYEIQKVRERYGLTRYNRKYFNYGDNLNLGFIRNTTTSEIIPVFFLDTTDIPESVDIKSNGEFCYRQVEVTNEERENNVQLSTIEDLSDIPMYTDYANSRVDEKIVELFKFSTLAQPNNLFIDNYNESGWEVVYPRIFINNLSLNDNTIELSSLVNSVVKKWNKYEDYSVLIRDDDYVITFDAETLLYSWIHGKVSVEGVNINDVFSTKFNARLQISNAELSIYLDAMEVSKTNAYPQASYEIEIAELNEDFIHTAYNRLNQIVHINDWELKFKNVLGYISELTLDLDEPWKDKTVIRNYKTKFEDLFSKIVVSSQQMQANAIVYDRAASAFGTSGLIKNSVLQDSINDGKINLSFLDNKFTIDQINGILAKSDDGILMFNNTGIFSATEKNEDGKWVWNSAITPFGINAGLLKAGTIDTNLIRIYAGDNLRFQMNSEGLFAFRSNEDGTANQNEYVVHNSEGLFLVNKKNDNTLINRVEVSWDGLKIRNKENTLVFSADNYGNLSITGTINAANGHIGGWNIITNGLYSGAQQLINSTAGIASGLIIDGQNNINEANNGLYKVFWAGRTNDGASRFYVDSNGDLFADSIVVNHSIVSPDIIINGIAIKDVFEEFNNPVSIGLTPLNGTSFKIATDGSVETNPLRFSISGQAVPEINNIKLQKYDNNTWSDIETIFNGTTYLTFSINYDIMNNKNNINFRVLYNIINEEINENEVIYTDIDTNIQYIHQLTFTLTVVETGDIIIVDIIANPTNNFNNGLAAGYNVNQLVLQANVYKNGYLIEQPEQNYECQWYKKVYINDQLEEQIINGATNFILYVSPGDLINKRSATYVCKISNREGE